MPTSFDRPASDPTRELAAIMFSDVVGYTAIMGRDEQQALRALEDHRELLRLLLPKFNGRMVGEIGDGTLTAFHSAIDAVNCAREVQASLQQDQPDLKVRIGIHLGDVVFSNNTVLGDGVNVASRIHALAPPGGICVSSGIHDEIRNKPGTRFKDLGERRLKNVSRPIHVYQVVAGDLIAQPATSRGGRRRTAGLGAQAEVDSNLVEWNYGEYEGLRTEEIRAKRPGWNLFRDGCPGGESVGEIGARVDRVADRVRALQEDVLIFSSGHFLRVLAARWLGFEPQAGEHFLLTTASLSALSYEDDLTRPVIKFWNDLHHLMHH